MFRGVLEYLARFCCLIKFSNHGERGGVDVDWVAHKLGGQGLCCGCKVTKRRLLCVKTVVCNNCAVVWTHHHTQ